ncbi:MAG: tetratricopeptide repeat protein [Dehalococcoidia bacterium]|nr:tetratricopeptide repeat protein [Dehalococcoidia bacterium]
MIKQLLLTAAFIVLTVSVLSGCSNSTGTVPSQDSTSGIKPGEATNEHNKQGVELLNQGKYKEAIAEFTQAIALQPEISDLYFNRGLANDRYGDIDAAIRDYTSAIQKAAGSNRQPDYKLYYVRGYDYVAKKEYGPAQADLLKAIELNPQYASSYEQLGIVFSSSEQYDKAIENYSRAIELQPKATTYFSRGVTYYFNKQDDEAVKDFTTCIEMDPKFAAPYYSRGAIYSIKGENTKALADLNKALELDPNYSWAYLTRGQVNAALGNKTEAVADFNSAIAGTKNQIIIDAANQELEKLKD